MNNNLLQREHYYKYLGIFLDSSLNFNKHIDHINKITSHKIYILSNIRKCIDQKTAIHIYKSMISPIFDYGDVIYEGVTQKRLTKLKRTQNKGLRVCLNIQGYVSEKKPGEPIIKHQRAAIKIH